MHTLFALPHPCCECRQAWDRHRHEYQPKEDYAITLRMMWLLHSSVGTGSNRAWKLWSHMRVGAVPRYLLDTAAGQALVKNTEMHYAYLHWRETGCRYWMTPLRGKCQASRPEHAKPVNEDVTQILTSFLRAAVRYLGGGLGGGQRSSCMDTPGALMETLQSHQDSLCSQFAQVGAHPASSAAWRGEGFQQRYMRAVACNDLTATPAGLTPCCHLLLNKEGRPFTSDSLSRAIGGQHDLPNVFRSRHDTSTTTMQKTMVWAKGQRDETHDSVAQNMESSRRYLEGTYAQPFQDGAPDRLRGEWFTKLNKGEYAFRVRVLPECIPITATGLPKGVSYKPALIHNPPRPTGCVVTFLEEEAVTDFGKFGKSVWRLPIAGTRSEIPHDIINASAVQSESEYGFHYVAEHGGYVGGQNAGAPYDYATDQATTQWAADAGISDEEQLLACLSSWRRRGTSLSIRPVENCLVMCAATGIPHVIRHIRGPGKVAAYPLKPSGLDDGRWRRLCEVEAEASMKEMMVSVQVPAPAAANAANVLVMRHLDWFSSLQEPHIVELRAGGGLELCLGAQVRSAQHTLYSTPPLVDECYVDLAPQGDKVKLDDVARVSTRSMHQTEQRTLEDVEAARIMASIPMAAQPAHSSLTPEEKDSAAAALLLSIAIEAPRPLTRRSKAALSKHKLQHE